MKKYLVMLSCILVGCVVVCAEDGITPNAVKLGQSCALSGPAQDLGAKMRAGLLAAFAKCNDEGGIGGRKVELVSKDDGYEPERAIENTRALIEEEKVFLLIGEVGTPTSKAAVPIAENAKVPFLAPFTGAEFLRNPFKKYVVNVRGSYFQETEKLAEYLVDHKGLKKIACFYQNDSYGAAGLAGIEAALTRRGLELVSKGTYERNTTAVKSGLLQIRQGQPEAVVMIGAYGPCAEFIKLAKKVGLGDAVFCNISFVGTGGLRKDLGADGDGVIISQVVVYPYDTSVPLVAEYTEAMEKYQPDVNPGFVSLEGYMAGKFFVMAARQTPGELTREALLSTVGDVGTFDLGGVSLYFGPNDHQGMDDVFLTVIRGGEVTALED